MRMKIPITGTVKEVTPYIIGMTEDPIRLIDVDLGDVRWRLVNLDLENEEMEIEATPNPLTRYDTGEVDGAGEPVFAHRLATEDEKQSRREVALEFSLSRKSKQALYALSKSAPLKNPFKVDPE